MIDNEVNKRVEVQVKNKMDKINGEIKKLQDLIETMSNNSTANTTPQRSSRIGGATFGSQRNSVPVASTPNPKRSSGYGQATAAMGAAMKGKVESQIGSGLKRPMTALAKKGLPAGPVSAEKDEIDEIYKEKDPINVSLDLRKKGGSLTTVVPNKNAKMGKFFFTLKTKGAPAVVTE